jgi:hypothetical protein
MTLAKWRERLMVRVRRRVQRDSKLRATSTNDFEEPSSAAIGVEFCAPSLEERSVDDRVATRGHLDLRTR